jgi:DNA-binding NarL/FixJ family response regulator
VIGNERPLPAGLDLTLYRIAQEALTNVRRHAGASECLVRLEYDGDAVRLTVLDDGAGGEVDPAGAGHGLLGMRERVGMYGGTLQDGPEPGRGFAVPGRAAGGDVTGEPPLRVLVVDAQELLRAGFRMILERGGIAVVGEAADGQAAVELADRLAPDVVLMDIRMPVLDGIEATRRLIAARPGPRVMVLTTFDLDEYVYEAVRAGDNDFLLKDIPPVDLVHAVRVVARGDALLAPVLTRRLLERFAGRPHPGRSSVLDGLTPRELEVMRLVAVGRSNAEIGGELFLSEATVKTYVSRLLTKLDVRDRVQLTVLAYESGLVVPGEA